jgi:hypothetical protein
MVGQALRDEPERTRPQVISSSHPRQIDSRAGSDANAGVLETSIRIRREALATIKL